MLLDRGRLVPLALQLAGVTLHERVVDAVPRAGVPDEGKEVRLEHGAVVPHGVELERALPMIEIVRDDVLQLPWARPLPELLARPIVLGDALVAERPLARDE